LAQLGHDLLGLSRRDLLLAISVPCRVQQPYLRVDHVNGGGSTFGVDSDALFWEDQTVTNDPSLMGLDGLGMPIPGPLPFMT
jgi:hypothetical protein